MKGCFETTQELWPFRPKPIGDESFSFSFSRVAWRNGLQPSELYSVAFPGARMFRLDLDRFAENQLVRNLAAHTAVPEDDIWQRTLRYWIGRLFECDDHRSKLIWLPPAGTQQSSKSFGQQACIRCLQDLETPYLSM